LFADRGVTHWRCTDFTGDHASRIESHTQLQRNTVTALNLGGQALSLPLDIQRRQTSANCMILQRNRRTKQRHDPVAGELIDRHLLELGRLKGRCNRCAALAAEFGRRVQLRAARSARQRRRCHATSRFTCQFPRLLVNSSAAPPRDPATR
jgi:hypothetical protein